MEPAKILVVDDERSILVLLKEALGQWGYLVTTAASAAEALGILKSELFDALITDRSEEHTSELQSRFDLVCRLLLEKKKYRHPRPVHLTPLGQSAQHAPP